MEWNCCGLISDSHGKIHKVSPTFQAGLDSDCIQRRGVRLRESVYVTNRNLPGQEASQTVIKTDEQLYASEAARTKEPLHTGRGGEGRGVILFYKAVLRSKNSRMCEFKVEILCRRRLFRRL